jgi:adenosylcobinamide-GDP ribazoletransferase
MRHELRLFLIALQFLTRVPVPAAVGWSPEWMNQSARHFAGVGLVVGGFGAAVLWAAAFAFPALVAVLLAMAATVWLTGAFHEDGLADTCDALGGAVSRERALEIMKDSRLGTYGAVALVFVLALKAATLVALVQRDLLLTLAALPLAHALSRAATVALLYALPYGGDAAHAKAKPLAERTDALGLVCAAAWALIALAAAAALGWSGRALALAGVVVALLAWWMARWLRRRLGGFTGDGLGATQQITELGCYLALLAALLRG